jgi:hypothetical protein
MHPLVTCPLGFSKRPRVRVSEFGMIANGFFGV